MRGDGNEERHQNWPFLAFQTFALLTDQPTDVHDGRTYMTDGRTWPTDVHDRRTYMTSNWGVRTHLKIFLLWRTNGYMVGGYAMSRDTWHAGDDNLYTEVSNGETRPDTRPSVADGWAGAEIRVFPLFNSSVTDQPTDRPTDGRTKPLIELRVRN